MHPHIIQKITQNAKGIFFFFSLMVCLISEMNPLFLGGLPALVVDFLIPFNSSSLICPKGFLRYYCSWPSPEQCSASKLYSSNITLQWTKETHRSMYVLKWITFPMFIVLTSSRNPSLHGVKHHKSYWFYLMKKQHTNYKGCGTIFSEIKKHPAEFHPPDGDVLNARTMITLEKSIPRLQYIGGRE